MASKVLHYKDIAGDGGKPLSTEKFLFMHFQNGTEQKISKEDLLAWMKKMGKGGSVFASQYREICSFVEKHENKKGYKHSISEIIRIMREVHAYQESGSVVRVETRLIDALNQVHEPKKPGRKKKEID